MPNAGNIEAPITLFSYGRSGTSLAHGLFQAHPDVDAIGETADIIFSSALAVEAAHGIVRGQQGAQGPLEYSERIARAVRALVLELFPSQSGWWMQKPIGFPFAWGELARRGKSFPEFLEWYWSTFDLIFPNARCFTVLRHPFDVVLSAHEYWSRPQDIVWRDLGMIAECIRHPMSKVRYAVNYSALLQNPEDNVKSLFKYLDLPFHPNVLTAFKKLHAPAPSTESRGEKTSELASANASKKKQAQFSRASRWNTLDASAMNPEHQRSIEALWHSFGQQLTFGSD